MTDTAGQAVGSVIVGNSLGNNSTYRGNLTGGGNFTKTGTSIQTLAGFE